MYFDETANKKITGVFLLINYKLEINYILTLNEIKNLIAINDMKISQSITYDFEKALLNSVTKVIVNNRL